MTKTDKSSKTLGGNTINEHIQEVLGHVKCWEMEMLNFYDIVQTQSVQANKTINVREEVLRIFGKKKEIKVVKREPVKQKKTPTDKKQEKEMARIAE